MSHVTPEADQAAPSSRVSKPPSARQDFLWPALALGALTLLCFVTPIDLAISGFFYSPEQGWFLENEKILLWIYDDFRLPAFVFAGAAAILFLLGFFYRSSRRWRRAAIYLILALILGPGLVVNSVLKDYWGRPRPRNVEEFGGRHSFERVWEYNALSQGKSFPSGHASLGFYFFCAYFLLRGRGRRWAVGTLGFTFFMGLTLGLTRIAQGGHFFSDILWSAGTCYFVCAVLFYALGLHRTTPAALLENHNFPTVPPAGRL